VNSDKTLLKYQTVHTGPISSPFPVVYCRSLQGCGLFNVGEKYISALLDFVFLRSNI